MAPVALAGAGREGYVPAGPRAMGRNRRATLDRYSLPMYRRACLAARESALFQGFGR